MARRSDPLVGSRDASLLAFLPSRSEGERHADASRIGEGQVQGRARRDSARSGDGALMHEHIAVAACRLVPALRDMRTVIIESPLRGATGSPEEYERNRAYARRCARVCLKEGLAPFASHLIYDQPGILDDLVPEERDLGIAAGLAWALIATKRIFFIDYGWSSGMLKAKAFYDEVGLSYEVRSIGCEETVT